MINSSKLLTSLAFALLCAGCASVPLDQPKTASYAIEVSDQTAYGQVVSNWASVHASRSGFFPLVSGQDALGARLELADNAQQSIDLQYFLMKEDSAGIVVSAALWRAADRGVRIRLLLDDVFTTVPDDGLAFLDAHPMIEVRIFNPIARRGLYGLNYLGHFKRANRRMHNKSFIVDNAISVVGGRNIADEYFQLKTDELFADFDMLAMGPIVPEISSSFDRYWNHALAIPLDQLIDLNEAGEDTELVFNEYDAEKQIYQNALNKTLIRNLADGTQPLFSADARIIVDDPDKLLNSIGLEHMQLATELGQAMADASSEIMMITPYYIPEEGGVDFIADIVDNGVRVVIVTNSLASNNHVPVHSAYATYRKPILELGAELYEARADGRRDHTNEIAAEPSADQLTMHTKLFLIDRRYLFV
ncbi:MAG: phospholipase D family protein, partial [Pseudomonadota bacterium]